MLKYSSSLLSPKRKYYNKKTNKLGNALTEVYDGNRISREGLLWYLEMGYIPGSETLFEDIEVVHNYSNIRIEHDELKLGESLFLDSFINPEIHNSKTKTELIKEGGGLFNEVIHSLFNQSTKKIVLPLTSGLDSRMILGGLLNCTEAHNITTLTWGSPNTLDFEVGKQISGKLGIKHYALDISKYELTEERLMNFADASDCSVPLFDHWPVDWVHEITDTVDGALWMGLLGGAISGSNLPKSFAENPLVHFLNGNNRIPSLKSLSFSLLNEAPTISDLHQLTSDFKSVSYDTLDIYFHHQDLIAPTKIHRGLDYILPFADPKLLNFFLSLPIEHRLNRVLLREIINSHYPRLASFPCNRNHGMGLNVKGNRKKWMGRYLNLLNLNISRGGKYISLKHNVEKDLNLKNLLQSKLQNLETRNLINKNNLNQIKTEFFGNGITKVDHSRAIDVLVSLEIILELVDYH